MFKIKKLLLICFTVICLNQLGFATTGADAQAQTKTTTKKQIVHKKKTHTTVAKKKIHHPLKHTHTKVVHHSKKVVNEYIAAENPDIELEANKSDYLTLTQATPPASFVASMEQRLVGFIQKSVAGLRYSSYKLGGSKVDTNKGIYIVDCSGYVDYTLRSVFPNAYLSLVDSSGSEKPNTLHYYNFFRGLSEESNEFWSKVEDIEQLQPGDILVFRYKKLRGRATAGHVMVVMNKPQQDGDTFLVSVADSAPVGHSQDTRHAHVSGVGIGSLLLKVNPKTGRPAAYAWRVGSRFKNNVNIAMARPTEDINS